MPSINEEEFVELELKRILEKYIKERKEKPENSENKLLVAPSLQPKNPPESTLLTKPEAVKQVLIQKEQASSIVKEKTIEDNVSIEPLKNKVPTKSTKEETPVSNVKKNTSMTFLDLESGIKGLGSSNRLIEIFFADASVPTRKEATQEELEEPEFFVFWYSNKATVVVPILAPGIEDKVMFVLHPSEKMPLNNIRIILSELYKKLQRIDKAKIIF
ncbi:MAG: hypothetical protein JTT12_06085 [Candidatus Brockarchaeota archaeon]|nr:hypothetical protein [Candidatus Brockarchaeota archaeon]